MTGNSSCRRTSWRLSLIMHVALLILCVGWAWTVEEVNESVLSGINERRQFIGWAPIVWPNNATGQAPGVFPSPGFYKDDSDDAKGSVFQSAQVQISGMIGSFVYFPEDRLPNDLGAAGTAPTIGASPTWNSLVQCLLRMKFSSYQVQVQQQIRSCPQTVDELLEIIEWSEGHTGLEDAEYAWQTVTGKPWDDVESGYVTPYASAESQAFVMFENSQEVLYSVSTLQTRIRIVVPDDSGKSGRKVAIYFKGFDVSKLNAGQIVSPEIVTPDGQYHRCQTLKIPSEGPWIEGGDNFAYIEEVSPFDRLVRGFTVTSDTESWPLGIAIGRFAYPREMDQCPPGCSKCPDSDSSVVGSPGQICVADGADSTSPSLIDNIRLTYRHWADDYRSPSDPASCSACSGGGTSRGDDLPCLSIRRVHRYDLIGAPSSFGPGVFLAQDISLAVQDSGYIDIIDPQASLTVRLEYDDALAAWRNSSHNLASGFDVSGGEPTIGGTATYVRQDGSVFVWTFIDDGSSNLRARLTEHRDRNGNAVRITYAFAATSSTGDLLGNRANIWRIAHITDAHGLNAVMTYANTLVVGRPVIERIDLPNGSHIDYRYNQAALGFASRDIVGFSGATLPENETVSVVAVREGNLVRITFDDPGADGIHRRKSVWLSEPDSIDPRTGKMASYRIREARLGTNEIAYRCRLESDGSDWQSIVQEGSKLLRLVHSAQSRILRTDRAASYDWSQPTSAVTWQATGNYTWDNAIRPTQWTNAAGKVYVITPDAAKNAPARVDHADGSYSTTTWNAFAQPLLQRDRTGRQIERTYDGSGNCLTETVGFGTPLAATTTWTYNARGQVLSELDPNGALTEYTYTTAGFLETMTEPPDILPEPGETAVRATWTYEYDAAGRRTAMIDPRSDLPIAQRRTTFSWDDRNRLISTTWPDTSTETVTYGSGLWANLVVRTKDRNGRIKSFDYDAAGRRVATKLFANQANYDANLGEIIESCLYIPGTEQESTCWRRGERIQYTVDSRGRRTGTTVWANATTALTSTTAFDAQGHPWLQTDPYNRRTIQLYNTEGNLVRTIRELVVGGLPVVLPTRAQLEALARIITPNPPYIIEDKDYDAEARLVERIDGRGVRTTYAYNARGQLADEVADAGPQPISQSATTHRDYDSAGRHVATVSPRGVTTRTDYTLRGLVWRVTEADGSAAAEVVATRSYSATRKLRFETDANEHTTEYQYGGCCDRLLRIYDPLQFFTTLSYDNVGNRRTVLDPNNLLVDTTYDAQNRVRLVTNAANEVTETIYDDNLTDGVGLDAPGSPVAALVGGLGFTDGWADGAAVALVDALGKASFEIRDGLGRPVRRIDPLGHVTRLSYDQLVTDTYTPPGGGAAITQILVATAMTDAEAHTTAQWVDGRGQVRVTVDGEEHRTRRGYDSTGNQVSERDPLGVGWDATYSPRGFLLSRTDTRTAGPVTTSWGYDLDGNRTSETVMIDSVAKTETYTYDLRNRRKTILDRLNGETTFDYDDVGNLLRITDAEGGKTEYVYDERNLLKEETFPGPTGGKRSYTYDPGRRLKTRTQQGAAVGGN